MPFLGVSLGEVYVEVAFTFSTLASNLSIPQRAARRVSSRKGRLFATSLRAKKRAPRRVRENIPAFACPQKRCLPVKRRAPRGGRKFGCVENEQDL